MAAPIEIDISDWLNMERELLAAFRKYWAAKHMEDPANFPSVMGAGDWDEQYCVFWELELAKKRQR